MASLLREVADRASFDGIIHRSFPITDFEFRDEGPTGFTFEGVASVVDHPYPVRDQFGEYTETIKAGAFNKTLRDGSARVSLYVNHRHSDVPLATRSAGTLTVAADPHLRVKASLDPARPDVQIIASAIKRGEMGEMSIGFNAVKTRDKWNDDWTEVVRGEVALREASIVEAGANTGGTTASLRAFDEFMASITDVEMSDDEIRRAIAHFSSLLPAEERNFVINVDTSQASANLSTLTAVIDHVAKTETVESPAVDPFAERDRQWRERLLRLKASAPAA